MTAATGIAAQSFRLQLKLYMNFQATPPEFPSAMLPRFIKLHKISSMKFTLEKVAAICEERCSGQGLYLSVNQSNLRAQKFYLALGAQNSQAAVWNAPDGTSVPTFRFSWPSAATLAENAANQSFKRDALKRAP